MPSLTGLGQTPGQPTEEAWRAGEQAPSYDYWSMGGYQEIPEDYMNDPRLTAGEKWVVDRLPGISSAIGGGMFGAIGGGLTFGIPGAVVGGIAGAGAGLVFPNAVGDALKYFNDSFLGKALLKLDIGAEYLERTMGMVALLSEAEEMRVAGDYTGYQKITGDLKTAWFAGSLFYDVSELPKFIPGTGMTILDDLPGNDGLLRARDLIVSAQARGLTIEQALEEVRSQYYTELGPLAIRAQLNDMYGHIFLDPLNLLIGALKPRELVQAARIRLLTTDAKMLPAMLVDDLENLADLERVANRMASVGDDAAALAKVADEFPEQFAKIERLKNIEKGVKTADDAADFVRNQADSLREYGTLSWGQQMFLRATGGIPGEAKYFEELTGWQKFAQRFNPIALTPSARAYEFVNTIVNNATAYLVGAGVEPAEIMRRVRLVADGLGSPELGHMVVSVEGRAIRGMVGGMQATAESMFRHYDELWKERRLLEGLARLTGESPYDIVRQMQKGTESAAAISTRLLDAVQNGSKGIPASDWGKWMDETASLFGLETRESLSYRFLEGIGGKLADSPNGYTPPYTEDLFKYQFQQKLIEYSGKDAVVRFGVKQQGFINAMSDALKSAESLAFLRANPAYPIKNFVNNVVTMVARGDFGFVRTSTIEKYFNEVLGQLPGRLKEAWGPAEIRAIAQKRSSAAQDALRVGEDIISAAERGEKGWLGNVERFFKGIGPKWKGENLDFGQLASMIEAWSSERAYYFGFRQGVGLFAGPGKNYDLISVRDPELATALGPDWVRALENAGRGTVNYKDVEKALGGNLNMTAGAIDELAEQVLGRPLNTVLPDDFMAEMRPLLMEAAVKGDGAMADALRLVKEGAQKHFDDALDEIIDVIRDEAEAMTIAERQGALGKILNYMVGDEFATHERHAMEMADFVNAELKGADWEVTNSLWRTRLYEAESYWGRFWKRQQARVDGVAAAAKKWGIEGADEFVDIYKGLRKETEQFFKTRNKLWGDWHEAKLAAAKGKTPKFTKTAQEIADQIGGMYTSLISSKRAALQRTDEFLAKMLPTEQQDLFLAGRQRILDMRIADMESVVEFRRSIRGLSKTDIEIAYNRHWRARTERWAEIKRTEKALTAALEGNPEASKIFEGDIQRNLGKAAEAAQEKIVKSNIRRGPYNVEATWTSQKQKDLFEAGAIDIGLRQGKYESAARISPETARANLDAVIRSLSRELGVSEQEARILANDVFRDVKSQYDAIPIETFKADKYATAQLELVDNVGIPSPESAKGLAEAAPLVAAREAGEVSLATEVGATVEVLRQGNQKGKIVRILKPASNGAERVVVELEDGSRLTVQGVAFRVVEGKPPLPTGEALFEAAGAIPQPDAALSNFGDLVKREMYYNVVLDELWQQRASTTLDTWGEAALDMAKRRPKVFSELPEDMQRRLQSYLKHVEGGMNDAKLASMKFAEFRRDTGLLNYRRRTNLDTWLQAAVPYEFWPMHTAFEWAMETLNRPWFIANALRMKKLIDTGFRPENGFPSRLKGHIRISLAWLPEEWQAYLGKEIFINPFRLALPLEQFAQPWEALAEQERRDGFAIARKLEELMNEGEITEEQFQEAMLSQSGDAWEKARAYAQVDDTQGRQQPWDLISMLLTPHAPIMWAMQKARGEQVGPVLPITRTIKGVTSLMGINEGKGWLGPEGSIRDALGLEPNLPWEEYGVMRAMVNLLGDKDSPFTVDDVMRAMIDKEGPAWEAGVRAYGLEYGISAIGATIGLPMKAYPPGEQYLRRLNAKLQTAYEMKDKGDLFAVRKFFDENPEMSARLALFDTPEERVGKYLVDQIGDLYWGMGTLNRNIVRDALGEDFERFINAEWEERIRQDPQEMALWLKLMGGDPPGSLGVNAISLQLAPPEIALVAENFYKTRNSYFPNWYDLQNQYYQINEENWRERRKFRQAHPELVEYWDWRRDFLKRNPSVIPYVADTFEPNYETAQEMEEAYAGEPSIEPQEAQAYIISVGGYALWRLVEDYMATGVLSSVAQESLQDAAMGLGLTLSELLAILMQSQEQQPVQ